MTTLVLAYALLGAFIGIGASMLILNWGKDPFDFDLGER